MGVMRCQRKYKPTTYDNTEIKRKKRKNKYKMKAKSRVAISHTGLKRVENKVHNSNLIVLPYEPP
jgi:hypothetical protein